MDQVHELAKAYYDDIIKGVVDIKREVIALGGEMHADSEEVLLNDGSEQSDLWGFNILLNENVEDCLVFESFINIRPRDDNKKMEVTNPEVRNRMKEIIFNIVKL